MSKKSKQVCFSKIAYETDEVAWMKAWEVYQKHNDNQHPYLCDECGNYHLTSQGLRRIPNWLLKVIKNEMNPENEDPKKVSKMYKVMNDKVTLPKHFGKMNKPDTEELLHALIDINESMLREAIREKEKLERELLSQVALSILLFILFVIMVLVNIFK